MNNMSPLIKKILIALNIIVLITALCVIGYFLIYLPIIQNAYQAGIDYTVNAIINQVNNGGEVRLNNDVIIIKKQ